MQTSIPQAMCQTTNTLGVIGQSVWLEKGVAE